MSRKVQLTVFVSMCFLSAIFLTQFLVSVRASPYTNVTVSQAKGMIDSNPDLQILDVRYQWEYDGGHLRNAILIPLPELDDRMGELDKNKATLVYCLSGGRSATASGKLCDNGFIEVYNMLGGITAWKNAGYPIEIVFDAIWEYTVAILSNSTITSFNFSQPLNQVSFNVTRADGTIGFCNVTIPIALLDGNFIVLINETQISYTLTRNPTHSFIHFSYSHSTQQVKVIRTTPVGGIYIPVNKLELLAPYIGLTTLLAAAVVAVGYVKKRKRDTEINS